MRKGSDMDGLRDKADRPVAPEKTQVRPNKGASTCAVSCGGSPEAKFFEKNLRVSWNVVDNKGPEMRKTRRLRLTRNVVENKWVN